MTLEMGSQKKKGPRTNIVKSSFIPPGALRRARGHGHQSRSFLPMTSTQSQTASIARCSLEPHNDNSLFQDVDHREEDGGVQEQILEQVHEDFDTAECNTTRQHQSNNNPAQEETQEGISTIQKKRKTRGMNKGKKITALKDGEKLDVVFYNNRVVRENHAEWSRHLGKIVRDPNIYPIRVHSWKQIGEDAKDHMWDSVKEKFKNVDIELYREKTLEHMNHLWNNWRGDLKCHNIKPCGSFPEMLKNVPQGMHQEDWEWLVKNHFCTKKFKETSVRNSENRKNLTMLHRTGSKPYRQIIYDLGGKDGNPPDIGTIFFETHKKGANLVDSNVQEKYNNVLKHDIVIKLLVMGVE
ncbi:uncharacterized protein LOC131169371 [Hevea brasiliensis]|uniref:uncharacterized protein LOC131169371 n=1 Tax=Hevea brasiliensis TaxID=3981 RepID=UPI0025D731D3|nr:uncharacterized protein LOC131169371 [Hevea brasiliensis]